MSTGASSGPFRSNPRRNDDTTNRKTIHHRKSTHSLTHLSPEYGGRFRTGLDLSQKPPVLTGRLTVGTGLLPVTGTVGRWSKVRPTIVNLSWKIRESAGPYHCSRPSEEQSVNYKVPVPLTWVPFYSMCRKEDTHGTGLHPLKGRERSRGKRRRLGTRSGGRSRDRPTGSHEWRVETTKGRNKEDSRRRVTRGRGTGERSIVTEVSRTPFTRIEGFTPLRRTSRNGVREVQKGLRKPRTHKPKDIHWNHPVLGEKKKN